MHDKMFLMDFFFHVTKKNSSLPCYATNKLRGDRKMEEERREGGDHGRTHAGNYYRMDLDASKKYGWIDAWMAS
jgi:hypothetical protein